MEFKQKLGKLGLISSLSLLMTAVTVIFAPPFIKLARSVGGSALFWSFQILILAITMLCGFQSLSLAYLILVVSIGIYSELEVRGFRLITSAIISVISTGGICGVIVNAVITKSGQTLVGVLREQIKTFVDQSGKLNSALKLDVDSLLGQVPSAVVSFLLIILFLAIVLESRVASLLQVEVKRRYSKSLLLSFKMPDFFVWIAMIAFLFSFVDLGNKSLMIFCSNIVNALAVLYFFQGIAIIESFFIAMKSGFFVRFLTYFILLIQLFLLVTSIGFIDYWADFRSRFIKKKPINV